MRSPRLAWTRFGRRLVGLLLVALLAAGSAVAVAAEPGHGGGTSGGGSSHDGGHDVIDHDDHGDASDHGGGHGGRGQFGGGRGGATGIHRGGHDSGRRVEETIFRGGLPVWAREGLPEVELGRLNMGRAPAFVLARALDEALLRYDAASMAAFYSLDAEAAAAQLASDYTGTARIESPQQNLALYRDVMMAYPQPLLPGITPPSQLDLAAIFLGSAADKGIAITPDSVLAINRILGLVPLDTATQTALANKADSVRIGLASGHGPEGSH